MKLDWHSQQIANRGATIVLLGLPAAGFILTAAIVTTLTYLSRGKMTGWRDWANFVVWTGLPLLIVRTGLRASQRVKQGGGAGDQFPLLARIAPVLIAVGAIGGFVIALKVLGLAR